MSPGELIYANSMIADEIALENKEKQSEGGRIGANITNGKSVSVQMDAERNKARDRSTNTREQRAKLAGVSTGTVSRYDTVMKSDDESNNEKLKWFSFSYSAFILIIVKYIY